MSAELEPTHEPIFVACDMYTRDADLLKPELESPAANRVGERGVEIFGHEEDASRWGSALIIVAHGKATARHLQRGADPRA